MAVEGVPVTLDVAVMNATDHPQIDLPVTIFVDGVEVETQKLMKMEAGETQRLQVQVMIPTAGRHLIKARLPQLDFLPTDDVRWLMLDVKREIPILLVDGNPGDNRTLGSTQYLQFAYTYPARASPAEFFQPR